MTGVRCNLGTIRLTTHWCLPLKEKSRCTQFSGETRTGSLSATVNSPTSRPTYLLTFTTLEQSSPCTVSKVGLTKLSFKKKFDCFHMALVVQPVTLPGQLLSSPLDHALSYVLKNSVTLDLFTFTSCCSYNRWWVMLSDSEHPTSLQAVPQLGGKSAHLECVRPWLKFTEQKVPI